MIDRVLELPPEQEAIPEKRFRPSGALMEYAEEQNEQSIPERFERIVRMYSGRIAVRTRDRELTYDDLNRTANRIGRAILETIGPGSGPIALLFGNGIDLIAALLGVQKAGMSFVAIDPSFPLSRQMHILRNAETRLILTNNKNWEMSGRIVGDHRGRLNIDEIGDRSADTNLGLAITSDKIATIVYTSGSTAEPKGVVKTHAYCLERAKFNIEFLSAHPGDRLSLLHSISFGSGEINLYASLLSGASLLPFDVKSQGIFQMAQWLTAEKITIFHCSPSLFRQFVDSVPKGLQFPKLRLIHLSGSPITRTDFEQYKKYFPTSTSLAIHMGATEAGCIACAVVDHTFTFPEQGTPAGFPREQKKVLVLDEEGHEVGPRQVGEIAVKSRYLASGYWRMPELTKAKFLPVPGREGERIYLTGDLGKKLPDGFLIHLGRKDFMIKIRGYRVELAEIERALLAHPQVKDAVVVAWDREPAEKYLAAYVIPHENAAPAINGLHNFLKEKLPDYMIPSAFVALDSFPLTPNGKIDRKSLPPPGKSRPELNTPFEEPRTPIERELAQTWSEILSLDKIGVNDNFFDLGGHSLAATRVVSQIIKKFQLEIPPQSLFAAPTVAEMAAVIETHQAKKAGEADLERLLAELESVSDDEARRLIAEESGVTDRGFKLPPER